MARDLRASYAEEFSCESDDINVEDVGLNRYRVSGCHRTVVYVCGGSSSCVVNQIADDSPAPAASPTPEQRTNVAAKRDDLGGAHVEKNKTGASLVALDIRLDAQTLLKLRGVPSAAKPVTFQIARLAEEQNTQADCDLAAMVNGQRLALPKAQRSEVAGQTNDARTLVTLQTELSAGLVGELALARKLAVRDCRSHWSLSEQALGEVRHFAELYQEEKAWQQPASEAGTGGLMAPPSGWPAWSISNAVPAASDSGPLLDAPALFKVLSPSVFKVVVASSEGTSQGSAVAVSKNELLTNCHVLEGAQTVTLRQGKVTRSAQIARSNPAADRCVLTTAEANLVPVRGVRPYSGLQVGEPLYTLGSPNGLELSLASGILSGKRDEENLSYVQTTAPISPGSSGGGLFDAHGNLVGITTLVMTGREHLNQSLNFAIPADAFWQP